MQHRPATAGREQTTHATGEASPSLMKNKNTREVQPATWMLEGSSGLGRGRAPLCHGIPSTKAGAKPRSLCRASKTCHNAPPSQAAPGELLLPPQGLGSSTQGCANSKGTIPEGPARAQSSPWLPFPRSPPLRAGKQTWCQHEEDSPRDTDPAAQARTGSGTGRGELREPRERHSGKCIYRGRMF